MGTYHLGFWNLENLFAPASFSDRLPWIASAMKGDLKGWTQARFNKKIDQLARAIAWMNDQEGPDLLGVCEVENRFVLEKLVEALAGKVPNRDYQLVHADAERDQRGIDTAFLFDANRLSVNEEEVFSHFVMRRTGTRDITQATFSTASGNEFVAMANHWPSRSGGAYESEGFRQTAGETLGYWHERIRQIKGPDVAVIAMGDFNDDPFDRSMTINARGTREREDVVNARSARLYNLSWRYLSQTIQDRTGKNRTVFGTLYFGGNGNIFDQILVSKGVLKTTAPLRCDEDSAGIDAIPDMVSHKKNEGAVRYGLPKGKPDANLNTEGYSDHFPVAVRLIEDD